MRVLLINSNLRNDLLAAPPIGICYVASAAEAVGHNVQVLDLCSLRYPLREVGKAIALFQPDVVGISIRNIDNANLLYPISYLPTAREMVSFVKQLTDAPIVLGGSGATLCARDVLLSLEADFIVVSEGEKSFVKLLDSIKNGKPPQEIPGVGMLVDGEFHLCLPDLHEMSLARPNVGRWIDMRPYEKMGASYNIQTKRGCNQRCIYCTYGQLLEGMSLRLRPPLDVVDEIEDIVLNYKPRHLEFVDSVFNNPYDHCAHILEEIARRPWKAEFTAMGVIPRNLDSQFLDLMWRAGFRSFWMSPESGSPRMIKTYGKSFTLDDMIVAAEALKKTRFTVMWCFLIGGPGENNDTLRETLNFTLRYLRLNKRPPYNVASYFLGIRLYPGTMLWKIALNQGFIKEDSNPLEQLWYVSEDLDLDIAVKELVQAAAICPEISLGFDEKWLDTSRIVAFVGRLFRISTPYWRHVWGLNQLGLKLGLRLFPQAHDAAGMIRKRLELQGYGGTLTNTLPTGTVSSDR